VATLLSFGIKISESETSKNADGKVSYFVFFKFGIEHSIFGLLDSGSSKKPLRWSEFNKKRVSFFK
jgi:hypothetical protein